MSRPPVFPAEQKTRIVLSILAGEISIAEHLEAAVPGGRQGRAHRAGVEDHQPRSTARAGGRGAQGRAR
jgi:hypothetical protein